jgi:hypothetical protein
VRKRRALLAALALLLCAEPGLGGNPRSVAIGPQSPKGALLIRVPPIFIDYQLLLVRVDETGTPSRREWFFVKPVPLAEGDRFVVETLPPGRYMLEGVAQQRKWVGCLHARTVWVDIEPGSIAYLGALDVRPTLASIQRSAEASKESVAHYGEWHFYRTGILAPALSERDAEGLTRAQSFVRERMPKSESPATLADLRWQAYALAGRSTRVDRCV